MSKLLPLAFIFCIFAICIIQGCEKIEKMSGYISGNRSNYNSHSRCWTIDVPKGSFVRIGFKLLNFNRYACSTNYLEIFVVGINETFRYCSDDSSTRSVIILSDVKITHLDSFLYSTSFNLTYFIESLICAQKDHFRCSPNSCVYQYQRCDGIKDCENGADEYGCKRGIADAKGINITRENVATWLKNQRSTSFGWGKNTHRAITALHLSNAVSFTDENLSEKLMVKQLELQTSVALLRNSSDAISVNELSMFVNALTVTCHNPRKFYGFDLLQILGERISITDPPSPSAYLTLCNSNWTFTESDAKRMMKLLNQNSTYPFISDLQAVAIMALTCMKNKTEHFKTISHLTSVYERTINKFIASQLPDGSFGNVYTTALVTQALTSSGQENNRQWNTTATARYLMQQMNSSSIDFLSAYLTLPIFNGRTLADIATVNCSNVTRRQGEDNEISDVTNKLGGKMRVQYSLYVGDQKDVIHTMNLRMPENSTVYDVMRMAQVADSKYKFLHRDVVGEMYVYEIAGITNDPEAGKFWLLYTENSSENGTLTHYTESPDKFILEDAEHLIMWYKTADI